MTTSMVAVDKHWFYSKVARETFFNMIKCYELTQPRDTFLTEDYLLHTLRTTWLKYIEETTGIKQL